MAQRKDKSQAMREKILNTATQLFIQKGSEKTSMQDIAQTAGISKGAIYHHFKSVGSQVLSRKVFLPIDLSTENIGLENDRDLSGNVTTAKAQEYIKNKAKAMRVLRSRLYDMEEAKKQSERAENRKNQVGSGDRSERIRTYNYPQNRVTDHRINLTLYKLDAIMQGDLNEIIDGLCIAAREQMMKAQV